MSDQVNKIWAIVPSAGVGQRMKQPIPKQYLCLKNRAIIEYTLETLVAESAISQITVSIAADDKHWLTLDCANKAGINSVIGGETRAHSVLNGLLSLSQASNEDWVLVHDAARPCLSQAMLQSFIKQLSVDEVGGILAIKSHDTVKLASHSAATKAHIKCSLNRDEIWYAQTPQMFRYGLLKKALQEAIENNALITDEASAMEMAGYHPRLIEGERSNFKITQPEDLKMANLFLQSVAVES